MAYDYSQSFRIDSSVVKGATQVDIHSVELFFKCKPTIGSPAQPNRSSIYAPGIEVAICPTAVDGTPLLSQIIDHARLEYNEIPISGDGSSSAIFKFPDDIFLNTDKEYAIVIKPDGQEDYVPWVNKKGEVILGTSTVSPGATDKFIGNLFRSQNRVSATSNNYAQGSGGQTPGGPASPNPAQWVPVSNEDLKFRVFVCNYGSGSGTGGGGNTVDYTIQSTHEYILFDRKLSKKEQKAKKGEFVYQNTSFHVGTVNIQPGNLVITGTNVNFETLYPQNANNENYIVFVSQNNDVGHKSGNNDKINVRKIVSIESNSTIIIDRLPTISNTAAKFLLPTPVGRVQIMDRSRSFNARPNSPSWYFSDRNKQDFMILEQSNANSSVRFVNNNIESIIISNGGSGYNNSDYVVISSASVGSVNAVANVSTNSTGGITSTYISNNGSGLIALPTASFKAANGATSNGTSASFSFIEGPTLRSENEKFVIRDVEVINWDIHAVAPVLNLNSPSGTNHKVTVHHGYYKDSANVYNVLQYSNANKKLMKNLKKNDFQFTNTPVLVSRSNEVRIANNMNYVLANGTVISTTVSSLVEINSTTDNDFTAKCVKKPGVVYYNYIINNDYTGENTPFGNALSKHISSTITMENGKQAEDILVYLRSFRPVGTDIKVFARVHNSKDPEAFDDRDWTLLDCIESADKFSSPTDVNDTFEYVYNFPAAPNTEFTAAGSITSESGNSTLIGTNSNFTSQVGGFAAGDLVKIYPALFPENYQISVVNSVTNSTALVLADKVTNTSLVGTGLLIDKLEFKHQAFNNILSDNVSRYYNTSMQGFDAFSTFAIKIVLLADNPSLYPQIEDIRAIAVSA
jgi:hypothetical protein